MPAMNQKIIDVMQRRAELRARISLQREQVAEITECWKTPLKWADHGVAVVRFLRSNPLLLTAVSALFVVRRRNVFTLMMGAWRVWQGYRATISKAEKSS